MTEEVDFITDLAEAVHIGTVSEGDSHCLDALSSNEYLSRMGLGPSEHGKYGVTILLWNHFTRVNMLQRPIVCPSQQHDCLVLGFEMHPLLDIS